MRKAAPIGDGKYVLKRRPPVEYVKPGKKKIVFLHKAMAQAYVRTFEPRPPLPRDGRPLAAVYEEYVSGSMGGLVFQEMRTSTPSPGGIPAGDADMPIPSGQCATRHSRCAHDPGRHRHREQLRRR